MVKFMTYHQLQDKDDYFDTGYRLIFRDEKDDTFEVTIYISLATAEIRTG